MLYLRGVIQNTLLELGKSVTCFSNVFLKNFDLILQFLWLVKFETSDRPGNFGFLPFTQCAL